MVVIMTDLFILADIIRSVYSSLIGARILSSRYRYKVIEGTLYHCSSSDSSPSQMRLGTALSPIVMWVKCCIFNLKHLFLVLLNMILPVIFTVVLHCVFGIDNYQLIKTNWFLFLPLIVGSNSSVNKWRTIVVRHIRIRLEVKIEVMNDCRLLNWRGFLISIVVIASEISNWTAFLLSLSMLLWVQKHLSHPRLRSGPGGSRNWPVSSCTIRVRNLWRRNHKTW